MNATVNAKVAYVKAQRQTRDHSCHWPGCPVQVPPAQWGCRAHWFKLPKPIRDEIWAAYRPGQEKTLTPSARYIAAARAAQEWIRALPSPAPQASLFLGDATYDDNMHERLRHERIRQR